MKTTTSPVLSLENLKKSYGDVEVLHDITLSMLPGDFLVLLGPSGCGKSTLLNCIAGLEEITSGSLRIGEADMGDVPPRDRDIAMVFQSYALYPTMTVGENITFGMKVRGISKAEQAEALARVAAVLQIEPLLERKPSELSGGQRQRVAMGRALVRDPKLFLFDEPLSNLDAKLRVEMRAEIRRLHETVNASVVYVTHDQIEAMTLATKICVMHAGYVQQFGTPDEIYFTPANTFVARFMGNPPMNIVPATCRREGAGSLLSFGDHSLAIDAALPEGPVQFGFRPEDAELREGASSFSAPLIVERIERTGGDTFAEAKLGETTVTIRLPARARVAAGDALSVTLPAHALHFFEADSGQRIEIAG
ncbi:ABC transporter ATP-binding protein [Pseudoruegeria sp. SHC-113]|uniref:ABC transporter ATP-binding protein n=1 Tax=Pseudoruegeria sp. SHC-113 TaxID=2855439 RepID=UPI0021BB5B09|nr:sn-glycerol-3-phosphate ABC transporter ATP-binding protein UgpC [Pseudoruegeria sp. SHC-113]MCT8159428.1 sn-glycerol-3-phosphate ABC transporter ATP-binding protein UgpC [Pseudoruegeria sp. SHC-113]